MLCALRLRESLIRITASKSANKFVTHFYFVIANDINKYTYRPGAMHTQLSGKQHTSTTELKKTRNVSVVRAQRTFVKCEIIKQSKRRGQQQMLATIPLKQQQRLRL